GRDGPRVLSPDARPSVSSSGGRSMEYVSRSYARLKRGHRRHFQQVVRHLDPQPEDRVLEIRCARGSVVRAVQSLAPHTYGIDVNPEAIASGVTHNLLVMSVE